MLKDGTGQVFREISMALYLPFVILMYFVVLKVAFWATRSARNILGLNETSLWFVSFLIPLGISSLLFPMVFPLITLPLFIIYGYLVPLDDYIDRGIIKAVISPFIYLGMFLIWAGQVYVLLGWSAYCAAKTITSASHHEVTQKWIYYLSGFLLCASALRYMAARNERWPQFRDLAAELAYPGSHLDRHVDSASTFLAFLYTLLGVGVFIIFCVSPGLMSMPYGWLLKLL
jgi:hypothetical protein